MQEIKTTDGTFLGRAHDPDAGGPVLVTLRGGVLWDITTKDAPLVRDICEMEDPVAWVRSVPGRALGPVERQH